MIKRWVFFPRLVELRELERERNGKYTWLQIITNPERRDRMIESYNSTTEEFNSKRYWWQSPRKMWRES